MFITKSNVLKSRVPTAATIGDNPLLDLANVTDPDFSTVYTSTNNSLLSIDFGGVSVINYVAFAGTDIATEVEFASNFSVKDGSTTIAVNFVKYNNCCVISFPRRAFSNLRVELNNTSGSRPPSVRYICAGLGFEVPNGGEVAGYARKFLDRNVKSKSSLNSMAAPTSYLTKKVDLKGSLSLPNMTKDFSENEWQDFLNFAVDNYFFIREQGESIDEQETDEIRTVNNSAYLCYEPTNTKVRAHQSTRSLNNISLSFKVFNGL